MYKYMNHGKWLHPAADAGAAPADGTGTGEDGTEPGEETTGDEGDGSPGEQEPEGTQPAKVEMTQDEIDAMVAKAKAQARRQALREANASKPGKADGDGDGKPAADDPAVTARLEKARERELRATARDLGGSDTIKLTSKGVTAALRLADFRECYDENGELVEDDVHDVLAKFAKEWPEFQQKAAPPPYAAGTGTKPASVDTGKYRKMSYTERLKLKQENPETYKKIFGGV